MVHSYELINVPWFMAATRTLSDKGLLLGKVKILSLAPEGKEVVRFIIARSTASVNGDSSTKTAGRSDVSIGVDLCITARIT